MKKYFILLLGCTIGLLLFSCAPTFHYQIYKVNSISELSKSNNDALIYEDENSRVFYNFWSEGGDAGFMFFNKSDQNIRINLRESFFIHNKIAYDYFLNREFTSSGSLSSTRGSSVTGSSSRSQSVAGAIGASVVNETNIVSAIIGASRSASTGLSATSSSSTTRTTTSGVNTKEQDVIVIPPKSAKIISLYNVNDGEIYRDCNLIRSPRKRSEVRTKNFSKEESPFVFSNRISYYIEETNVIIEHNFYVSEISNPLLSDVVERRQITDLCGKPIVPHQFRNYYKNPLPNKFFIRYSNVR